jgi:hypothetical protein
MKWIWKEGKQKINKRKREMLEWAEIPLFGPLGNHLCAAHPLRTRACWRRGPPISLRGHLFEPMTRGATSSAHPSSSRWRALLESHGLCATKSTAARPMGPTGHPLCTRRIFWFRWRWVPITGRLPHGLKPSPEIHGFRTNWAGCSDPLAGICSPRCLNRAVTATPHPLSLASDAEPQAPGGERERPSPPRCAFPSIHRRLVLLEGVGDLRRASAKQYVVVAGGIVHRAALNCSLWSSSTAEAPVPRGRVSSSRQPLGMFPDHFHRVVRSALHLSVVIQSSVAPSWGNSPGFSAVGAAAPPSRGRRRSGYRSAVRWPMGGCD